MPRPSRSRPAALGVVSSRLALAAGLGLAGCTPTLPEPLLSNVDPAWGYNGEETLVEVSGVGFYPVVQVDLNQRSDVDDQFEIWLLAEPEVELTGVELLDHEHLQGRVPPGVVAGTYGIRVVSPAGLQASLDDAFTVRNTRGDELSVTTTSGQTEWRVGEYASLTVELLDPDGQRAAEDLLVSVTVPEELQDVAVFEAGTLADQLPLPDGSGITGRLGPDGIGVVGITATEPVEQLRLSFVAAEDGSPVSGDSVDLRFVAGDAASLVVQLPSTVFDAVAGEAFEVLLQVVDEDGNPVDDASGELVLIESCPGGTFVGTAAFSDGNEEVELTFTQATGEGCALSSVLVVGFIDGVPIEAESDGFEVLPGEAQGLVIEIDPLEIAAGEVVLADVQAIDEYGNSVPDAEGSLSVQVSADGAPAAPPAAVDCNPLDDGDAYCLVQVDTAGDEVVLLVGTSGPSPLSGVSEPFTVLAGAATSLVANLDTAEAVAGEPFLLSILAQDALGNGVRLDPLGADLLLVDDPVGDVACSWLESGTPTGTEHYACEATQASAARMLAVSLPSRGVAAEAGPVSVVNGPLSLVYIDLGAVSSVVAGGSISTQLRGTDDWDNPYVVQDDPVVDLQDLSGAVSPARVSLSSEGTAVVSVTVTVAREDDRLLAYQDGVELGASSPFDVRPGPAASLVLEAPRTWAWVDEAVELQVQALDAYGNLATGHDDAVTVTSGSGLGDAQEIPALDEGQGAVSWVFHTRGLADTLTASDGSLSGSLTLDAVDAACGDPPRADLAIGGEDSKVLCIIDSLGRTPVVRVDASGTTEGSAPLSVFHFEDGEGSWTRSTSESLSTSWSEAGRWELLVVAVDAVACGDQARASVYVGPDDGSAVGPVVVELAETELYTEGSSEFPEESTVRLQARTCTEDAAADAVLHLWVDRGNLDPATVDSSGEGLQLTLDASGSGEVTWSVSESVHAGEGTLHAGVPTGQAYGEASLEVLGDLDPPRLVRLDPAGTFSSSTSTLTLQFSEPILASSVQASALALTDPDGFDVALLNGDLTLSSDQHQLSIDLPEPLDGSAGAWLLELYSTPRYSLRDLEGNILDGGWTGAASDAVLLLGDVPDEAPDLSSCGLDTGLFRPDGDDGPGDAADYVDFTATATGPAAWWRLTIKGAAGNTVLTRWEPDGAGSSTSTTWDGRSDEGRVLPNGRYDLTLAAGDEHWNTGTPCTRSVQLDNEVAPLD